MRHTFTTLMIAGALALSSAAFAGAGRPQRRPVRPPRQRRRWRRRHDGQPRGSRNREVDGRLIARRHCLRQESHGHDVRRLNQATTKEGSPAVGFDGVRKVQDGSREDGGHRRGGAAGAEGGQARRGSDRRRRANRRDRSPATPSRAFLPPLLPPPPVLPVSCTFLPASYLSSFLALDSGSSGVFRVDRHAGLDDPPEAIRRRIVSVCQVFFSHVYARYSSPPVATTARRS